MAPDERGERRGGVLPTDAYYESLPRNLTAASVLFHYGDQVLVVQPAWRPERWSLPGGTRDPDEDPAETARREVFEELGLDLDPAAALLGVDWVPAGDGRPPLALYVFDGGPLDPVEAERRVRLQVDELLAWRYAGPAEWPALLAPHAVRRIAACLPIVGTGRAVYLHHGRPPPTKP